MSNLVKIYAHPKLNTPNMVASWPGLGDVSPIVATYLKRKLGFKKLAEVETTHFFDPTGVAIKNGIVEAPQFPSSEFHYWKNPNRGNDIILFIGEDQPTTKIYELANCVLDVGLRFQVNKVYTCAAALTRIHHTEEPRVWGVATTQQVMEGLEKYNLLRGSNLQIAGLNGLILGIAKERDTDGICLLGEVPMQASRMQNPMAALAILEILTEMLGIEIDTAEIAQLAEETKEKMRQAAAAAMGEYIDYFTKPIWEYGEEEEEE